jgi:hypothetical protein
MKLSKFNNEPFIFWLIKENFSAVEESTEESKPLTGRQFYLLMAAVILGALAYGLVFGFVPNELNYQP